MERFRLFWHRIERAVRVVTITVLVAGAGALVTIGIGGEELVVQASGAEKYARPLTGNDLIEALQDKSRRPRVHTEHQTALMAIAVAAGDRPVTTYLRQLRENEDAK